MGANVNGTFDIIRLIEKTWSSIWGVLVVWLAEILAIVFFHKQLYQLPKVGIIILIVVFMAANDIFTNVCRYIKE